MIYDSFISLNRQQKTINLELKDNIYLEGYKSDINSGIF